MKEKIYNINITIQEYDEDGFWDVFGYKETSSGKKELKESLDIIVSNCKKFIEKRVR